MAEAFLNRLGKDNFEAESAGIEAGKLNPLVVEAMSEIGYDISKNQTKSVFDFFKEGRTYSAVIKVCDQVNGQRCPVFPKTLINLSWNLEDPSALVGTYEEKLERVRQIRDQIKVKIEEFIQEYEKILQD
jgi:arsenate reductase